MSKKILSALLALIVIGVAGFYVLAQWQIRNRVDTLIAQTLASGTYEELDYQELDVALNGDISLRGVRVVESEGISYQIEEVLITDYDLTHETPYYMTTQISGISFPDGLPDGDDDQSMGLSTYIDSLIVENVLPITMSYRYNYVPQNNDELTSSMSFHLPGALVGAFDGTIHGIPMEELSPANIDDPEQAQARMLAFLSVMEIPNLSITFSDLGMVEALIRIGAEINNLELEEYREGLRAQAESLYFLAPQSLQEFALNLGDQLAIFIDGGASLSITARPEYGGNLQRLQAEIMGAVMNQNFGVIPDLLNLEISAQPN